MIASLRRIRAARAGAVALALCGAAACASPGPYDASQLLEPLALTGAVTPDDSDLAAARLAEASLAYAPGAPNALDTREALDAALAELESAEGAKEALAREAALARLDSRRGPRGQRRQSDRRRVVEEHRSRLVPLALDLVNATVDDPREYRKASRELRKDPGIDPALKERLDRAIADDPLALAAKRNRDEWERIFAHNFNAVSKPLGQGLLTGVITAPYTLALGAVHWFMGLFEGESFGTQERQALAHRQQFLRAYPNAPEADEVRKRVAKDEARLHKLHYDRSMASAKSASENGRPRMAAIMAKRALYHEPGDKDATELYVTARGRVERQRSRWRRSETAAFEAPADLALSPERTRKVIEGLWLDAPDLADEARRLAEADPTGSLDDEVEYLLGGLQLDAGYEEAGWKRLERLARLDPRESNEARHAAALVVDPWRNPYGDFLHQRSRGRERATLHEFLGGWANGPRYKSVNPVLAYLIDLPNVIRTVVLTPIRALLTIGQPRPDFQTRTAAAAYRYLGLIPNGEHSRELLDWLYDYEEGRGNWDAALRIADFQPGFDAADRAELAEKAAERRLSVAEELERRDQRGSVLRQIVLEYPDTESGHHAGMRARREVENASAQRIRMTRSFLQENPTVAGYRGLGIRDSLLDGQLRNGEIHPEGVTFLGGRVIEFALVAEDGDDDSPPERVRRVVAPERLARCVALVEETSQRNARLDADDEVTADARRDLYFERARLGLTGNTDVRPTAESDYVFRSMRERYGLVRGRESILPFDLVLQGSLEDLSLGAFPRWRQPKPTPDAFLYR